MGTIYKGTRMEPALWYITTISPTVLEGRSQRLGVPCVPHTLAPGPLPLPQFALLTFFHLSLVAEPLDSLGPPCLCLPVCVQSTALFL